MSLSETSSPGLLSTTARTALQLWVGTQVGLAAAALIAVAATPIRSEIGFSAPGIPAAVAVPVGMLFWLGFGLLGGIRARPRAGGGVMTFSMPFIVAGTLLGGPLAGGLMGLVSELELREIRTQPWYGTLANHAVAILAAIAAAAVGFPAHDFLARLLPGQEPLAFFGGAMVAALVFDTVNVLLVVPTLALKHDLTLREASRTPNAAFRATAVAEAILAWNMAAGYLALGWWAPIASAALVLIVWQAHDRREALHRDDLTGLLSEAGFRPRVEAAIATARVGRRCSALLTLDLDGFWKVNDQHGMAAGDEVLVTTARRILGAVRATDSVARRHRAGDELAILFDGMPDIETARQRAWRLQQVIREPIRLRGVDATVEVGVSIGVVFICGDPMLSAAAAINRADDRMELAKDRGCGVVAEDLPLDQGLRDERIARKNLTRSGGDSGQSSHGGGTADADRQGGP